MVDHLGQYCWNSSQFYGEQRATASPYINVINLLNWLFDDVEQQKQKYWEYVGRKDGTWCHSVLVEKISK